MVDPLTIRVERPYANEEEFLDAEAWSITARSVLLIGVESVPEGTSLRFELRLVHGSALVVAEGVAVKHLAATTTRPAGLVVRYKRMSAASSDFVKRAAARAPTVATPSSPNAVSRPVTPPTPSRPPAGAASTDSGRPPRKSSGPPPRPSRSPAAHQSARPSAATSRTTNPPARVSGPPPPKSGSSSSVSVIPAARRVSSLPPEAPARIESGRSARPAPTPSSPNPGGSRRPLPKLAVPVIGDGHDSAAMQRLRSRTATRAISTPPDREAILSRLKKKPKG